MKKLSPRAIGADMAAITHRYNVDIPIWRVERRNDHLATTVYHASVMKLHARNRAAPRLTSRGGAWQPKVRPEAEKSTHLTAAGVPLKSMATNRSTSASAGMNLARTIAWTVNTPITGRSTIFAIVTSSMAMIGSLESGRGSLIRANEAPSRIRASGTAMVSMNCAVGRVSIHEGAKGRGKQAWGAPRSTHLSP